jgi:hypothetical protein
VKIYKKSRPHRRWFFALAYAVALTGGAARSATDVTPTEQIAHLPSAADTKAIAEKGLIYGLPLVMNLPQRSQTRPTYAQSLRALALRPARLSASRPYRRNSKRKSRRA